MTCTVLHWLPLFTNCDSVQIILDSLTYLQKSDNMILFSYVILENYLHLVISSDDILLFDKNNIEEKIIMGESKFRGIPTKKVIEDIIKALSKDNLPISLAFVRDRLDELGENGTAELIDDLISDIHKKNIPIGIPQQELRNE